MHAGWSALWLLALAAVPARAQNLLENGTFEEGPRPDCPHIGKGWEAVEDGCLGFIQALDATTKHSALQPSRFPDYR